MTKERVIGLGKDLPWYLPEELAYFKKMTMGKPIIMGQRTFESIRRPLVGRKNIILSKDKNFQPQGALSVNSIKSALEAVKNEAEVMIIGGASVYEQFLPLAQRIYLTIINRNFKGDVFFPKINYNEWREVSRKKSDNEQLEFIILERIKNFKIKNKVMNKIAKVIDHTDIRKEATMADIKKRCAEAKQYGFHGVVVNPQFTALVKRELKGIDIKTTILIDPPMGLSTHQKRLDWCKKAKRDGADELDVVINIVDVKYGRYDKILRELIPLCAILPTKVIIGSGFLTDEEIKETAKIVKKSGAFCIKTATSKDPLENREIKEKIHHIKLMKQYAPGLVVKVSGNIKTLEEVKKTIKAGADIVGTSSGLAIMKEIEKIKRC